MAKRTTLGQVLVNEALPEDMRDYNRVWDKTTAKSLYKELAQKHPDKYKEVTSRLLRVGESAATTGNFSLSLNDLTPSAYKIKKNKEIQDKVTRITDSNAPAAIKKKQILDLLNHELPNMVSKTLKSSLDGGSHLARLVSHGSKGSPAQFNSVAGSSLMFTDLGGKPVMMPILNSISQGLDPAEYWAGSYGTRTGAIGVKFSTQDAGFFGKKVSLAMQRSSITEKDCKTSNGIAVEGNDKENIGTILQMSVAGIPAGTVIGPEHLKRLKDKSVIVRSPITCQAKEGLCSKCAGIRETGKFPLVGDNVGLATGMVLSERLSQTMLNTKHTGGAAGKRTYSFDEINNLFEMPKHDTKSATLASVDGVVKLISKAPAGGYNIKVGDEDHWVKDQESITVKVGDAIEAGDIMSDGLPNVRDLANYRGVGDARQVFSNYLRKAAGSAVTRRNSEIIARSMIRHVATTDSGAVGDNGLIPGDISSYDALVKNYKARPTAKLTPMSQAKGRFLEQPLLHYSIGTRVTNRMLKDFKTNKNVKILTHEEAPGFEPAIKRLYEHSQADPDWMARMSGYKLKDSFIKGVQRGDVSESKSTSFIPAMVKGVDFAKGIEETGRY